MTTDHELTQTVINDGLMPFVLTNDQEGAERWIESTVVCQCQLADLLAILAYTTGGTLRLVTGMENQPDVPFTFNAPDDAKPSTRAAVQMAVVAANADDDVLFATIDVALAAGERDATDTLQSLLQLLLQVTAMFIEEATR